MIAVHVEYDILHRCYRVFAIQEDQTNGTRAIVMRDGQTDYVPVVREDEPLDWKKHSLLTIHKSVAHPILQGLVEQLAHHGISCKSEPVGALVATKDHLAHVSSLLGQALQLQHIMLEKMK